MLKKQRYTARVFEGLAGIIQHQFFLGILYSLNMIVLVTMIGIFTLAGRASKMQVYAIVGTCAYLGSVLGYYLSKYFLSKSLRAVESVEKAMIEMADSDQLLSAPRLLPETGDSIRLVQAYNLLATRLQEAESHKLEFVSLAAHELHSPVASIANHAELLADPAFRHDEVYLDTCQRVITQQSRHVLNLISDILNTAKMEDDPRSIRWGYMDLHQLVQEIVNETQDRSGRMLCYDNEAGEVCLLGDALRLREVILNLLDNALKYSAPDQPVHISLKSGDRPGWIELSVTDHGIGIDDRDLPKLFTRFGRIKNEHTREIQGTGLGLYIARMIVKRHNGRITVQSKRGVGSTFTIDLPILQTEQILHSGRKRP